MIRKPSGYTVAVVSLLVATILWGTVSHVRRARLEAGRPHTLEEAAERIRAAHPEWHVVGGFDSGEVGNGFYVTTAPRNISFLKGLFRNDHVSTDWRGVVFVEKAADIAPAPPFVRCNEFSLYGEPDLVAGVVACLK